VVIGYSLLGKVGGCSNRSGVITDSCLLVNVYTNSSRACYGR